MASSLLSLSVVFTDKWRQEEYGLFKGCLRKTWWMHKLTHRGEKLQSKASNVIITALSSSLTNIKGDFSLTSSHPLFSLFSPPLTAQLGELALIAPKKLWKHNKCFSSWYNCVCRSWRAWEERGLWCLKERLCRKAWELRPSERTWYEGALWWTDRERVY